MKPNSPYGLYVQKQNKCKKYKRFDGIWFCDCQIMLRYCVQNEKKISAFRNGKSKNLLTGLTISTSFGIKCKVMVFCCSIDQRKQQPINFCCKSGKHVKNEQTLIAQMLYNRLEETIASLGKTFEFKTDRFVETAYQVLLQIWQACRA